MSNRPPPPKPNSTPSGVQPNPYPTFVYCKEWENRPARKQVTSTQKLQSEDVSGFYNIWYHKICGENSYRKDRIRADTRCNIAKDTGKTRAEKSSYICLYFSRGKCSLGSDCNFFHRIPNEDDEKRLSLAYDIFGRERYRTDRDDMGGVGTFSKDNRTLYIGSVRIVPGINMEQLVWKHFSEWGELEYARVITPKSIAFVKYRLRACAEFAKEAMSDQSLGYNEILNVRWANDDPNPAVKAHLEKEKQEKAFDAMEQKYGSTLLWEYTANKEYAQLTGAIPDEQQYPNTDYQFQGGEGNQPAIHYQPTDGQNPAAANQNQDGQYGQYQYDPSQETPQNMAASRGGFYGQYYSYYFNYYGYPGMPPQPGALPVQPGAYPGGPTEAQTEAPVKAPTETKKVEAKEKKKVEPKGPHKDYDVETEMEKLKNELLTGPTKTDKGPKANKEREEREESEEEDDDDTTERNNKVDQVKEQKEERKEAEKKEQDQEEREEEGSRKANEEHERKEQEEELRKEKEEQERKVRESEEREKEEKEKEQRKNEEKEEREKERQEEETANKKREREEKHKEEEKEEAKGEEEEEEEEEEKKDSKKKAPKKKAKAKKRRR